jgi:hypothetical protein
MPTGYQLTTSVKPIRVANATSAGSTAVNTSFVDCLNADGVRFVALLGALTVNQVTSMKLQGATLANGADVADLLASETGTVITTTAMADGDTNKTLVVEVYKPKVRYIRAVVNRATANAVIDGVVAELVLRNPLSYTADVTQAVATAKGSYAKI